MRDLSLLRMWTSIQKMDAMYGLVLPKLEPLLSHEHHRLLGQPKKWLISLMRNMTLSIRKVKLLKQQLNSNNKMCLYLKWEPLFSKRFNSLLHSSNTKLHNNNSNNNIFNLTILKGLCSNNLICKALSRVEEVTLSSHKIKRNKVPN